MRNYGEEHKDMLKNYHVYIILAVFSIGFIYLLSPTTSFRYTHVGGDSAVFQVMGKYWLEGVLPYSGLFDHKGPLVYLIDAMGYMIYPRSGIMLFQIVGLFISLLYSYKTICLFWEGKKRMVVLFLSFLYYAAHFDEGNRIEEWSMCFLIPANYFFLKYVSQHKNTSLCHPWKYSLFYGIGVGACLMLRLTNAMMIFCEIALVFVFLWMDREYRCLRDNVMGAIAGFGLAVIPFAFYFYCQGTLNDAVYGIFLFNAKYAIDRTWQELTDLSFYMDYVVIHFLPLLILVAISIYELSRDCRNRMAWGGLVTGGFILAMLLRLRLYPWYCMIILPQILYVFSMISVLVADKSKEIKFILEKKGISIGRVLIILAFCLYCTINIIGLEYNITSDVSREKVYQEQYHDIMALAERIPLNERDSFMSWGRSDSVANWVLVTGIRPRDRFFYNVKEWKRIDFPIYEEWFQRVYADPPRWILYGNRAIPYIEENYSDELYWVAHKDDRVDQLLDERYELQGTADVTFTRMKLYRLRGDG